MQLKTGFRVLIIASAGLALFMLFTGLATKQFAGKIAEFYVSKNETYMRNQAGDFLSQLTGEQSMRYEAAFQKIAAASSLISKQAAFFLENTGIYGRKGLAVNERLAVYPPNGIFSNDTLDRVMAMYWGSSWLSLEITQQMNALSHADPLLIEIKKLYPECAAAYIVTESAIMRYVPNVHAVEKLPRTEEYDVRNENFYQIAMPKNNAGHNTVWTDVYVNKAGNGLMITASTPVYNRKGQYIGAAGVDLMLDKIINDILSKKRWNSFANEQQDIMNSFFSFLTDRKGKSIVFPSEYAKVFGLGPGKAVSMSPGFVYGYSLLDAVNTEVERIGQNMIEKEHEAARFFPDGSPYMISFHSIPSTGWRIGIAVPESAILASVQETLDALNIIVGKISMGFFSAAVFFMIFAVIAGAAFSMRYFVKPPDSGKTDDIKEERTIEDNFIEEFVIEEDLTMEDLTIEDLIIEEETAKKPVITEENVTLDISTSYSKLVKALQKVTEVEKEHSVKLQEEISERRRVEEEIRHLSSRLINSNEEGRKALAQDLHDEFGQTLAALHMSAESLHSSIPEELKEQKEKIGSLIQLIEHLGDKIRSISSDLRPDLLDDLGLVPTLEWYIKEFHEKRQDIKIAFQAIGFVRKRLSPDAELVLYRIFQESINNVIKHAKAQEVNVTLTYSHPNVIFIIKDNGAGFDEKTRGKDGIGLLGMRERVVGVKGTIDIRSAIGKGTTLRVELPVV